MFTLAGTLFASASGRGRAKGATLRIEDSAGRKLALVTADDGNFWTDAELVFPLRVGATACPNTVAMVEPATDGDCNVCHDKERRAVLPTSKRSSP